MKHFLTMAAALLLLACGCVSYQYKGEKTGEVTKLSSVKVFTDSAKVGKPYKVLGRAQVSGNYQDVSYDRMVEKLTSEASKCGANAVLIVERQVIARNADEGKTARFMTAFDYDDSNRSWSQISRDVDLSYGNISWGGSKGSPAAGTEARPVYKRIIRAEFLQYTQTPVPPAKKKGTR